MTDAKDLVAQVPEEIEVAQPKEQDSLLAELQPTPEVRAQLVEKSANWAERISGVRANTVDHQNLIKEIRNAGKDEIGLLSSTTTRFTSKSLSDMKNGSTGASVEVSKSLVDLRNLVVDLDPTKEPNILTRLLFRNRLSKRIGEYAQQYKSSEEHLNAITLALVSGRDALSLDNHELAQEAQNIWRQIEKLYGVSVVLGELRTAVENSANTDPAIRFEVLQRQADVESQVNVYIQTFMSIGILTENNQLLIRSVDRAEDVTMTALRNAVMIVEALENQRRMVDTVDAMRETTGDMMKKSSLLLKQNAVQIQEQASKSAISPEDLQESFANIVATLNQAQSFKERASDAFSQQIVALQDQREQVESALKSMHDRQEQEAQLSSGSSNPSLTSGH